MTADTRSPLAIRVTRPYDSVEAFLAEEGHVLTRSGVVLVGAQPRPEGTVMRFELVLRSGEPLIRGEGRVLGHQPHVMGEISGLALRFTRLDARTKALLERVRASAPKPIEPQKDRPRRHTDVAGPPPPTAAPEAPHAFAGVDPESTYVDQGAGASSSRAGYDPGASEVPTAAHGDVTTRESLAPAHPSSTPSRASFPPESPSSQLSIPVDIPSGRLSSLPDLSSGRISVAPEASPSRPSEAPSARPSVPGSVPAASAPSQEASHDRSRPSRPPSRGRSAAPPPPPCEGVEDTNVTREVVFSTQFAVPDEREAVLARLRARSRRA